MGCAWAHWCGHTHRCSHAHRSVHTLGGTTLKCLFLLVCHMLSNNSIIPYKTFLTWELAKKHCVSFRWWNATPQSSFTFGEVIMRSLGIDTLRSAPWVCGPLVCVPLEFPCGKSFNCKLQASSQLTISRVFKGGWLSFTHSRHGSSHAHRCVHTHWSVHTCHAHGQTEKSYLQTPKMLAKSHISMLFRLETHP